MTSLHIVASPFQWTERSVCLLRTFRTHQRELTRILEEADSRGFPVRNDCLYSDVQHILIDVVSVVEAEMDKKLHSMVQA